MGSAINNVFPKTEPQKKTRYLQQQFVGICPASINCMYEVREQTLSLASKNDLELAL